VLSDEGNHGKGRGAQMDGADKKELERFLRDLIKENG